MEIEQNLLNKLVSENSKFKTLYNKHNELKSQVEALNNRKFLTPVQEVERKNLQKQKLISKDQLMAIVVELEKATS